LFRPRPVRVPRDSPPRRRRTRPLFGTSSQQALAFLNEISAAIMGDWRH